MTDKPDIVVVGAGIVGLWQALLLTRAGYRVALCEQSAEPFVASASQWAGAMLAPDCEAESAPAIVRTQGHAALAMWRAVYASVTNAGTLVVANARDDAELNRFLRMTSGGTAVSGDALADLEPELAPRIARALYFADEAHMDAQSALHALLAMAEAAGVSVKLGAPWHESANTSASMSSTWTIDCRGMAAQDDLDGLRGVRGERVLIQAPHVNITRPIRLLHPRQPIYVVPQGHNRYVIGATVIERDDAGPMTVRSALELLGSAYALHPGFAEAAILNLGAGLRPAFADNVPKIFVDLDQRIVRVNGTYRHGFLLAPVLADAVVHFFETGEQAMPFAA